MLQQVIHVVNSTLPKINESIWKEALIWRRTVCEKNGVCCGEIERIRVKPVVAYLNLLQWYSFWGFHEMNAKYVRIFGTATGIPTQHFPNINNNCSWLLEETWPFCLHTVIRVRLNQYEKLLKYALLASLCLYVCVVCLYVRLSVRTLSNNSRTAF
jgi:hypothetical protein